MLEPGRYCTGRRVEPTWPAGRLSLMLSLPPAPCVIVAVCAGRCSGAVRGTTLRGLLHPVLAPPPRARGQGHTRGQRAGRSRRGMQDRDPIFLSHRSIGFRCNKLYMRRVIESPKKGFHWVPQCDTSILRRRFSKNRRDFEELFVENKTRKLHILKIAI